MRLKVRVCAGWLVDVGDDVVDVGVGTVVVDVVVGAGAGACVVVGCGGCVWGGSEVGAAVG